MMRLMIALIGLALSSAAGSAPRDWSGVAVRNAAGAYVIGNPAAKVKLVEYASYTCSHCAAFSTQSASVLRATMIRSGSTSLEVRHYIRDTLDLAAALLARCAGPRGFAGASEAIFANQATWLPRGTDFAEVNNARLQVQPQMARLHAYADGAGLTELMRTRGMTPATIDACFANDADAKVVVAMTAAAPAVIPGTPTFFVNGRIVPHTASWASLEPVLRAAGAK